jgi:four helix bundle protein
MCLELSHTRLDIFKVSKDVVINCYRETKPFPQEEKFGIVQQIRTAALAVHLNIAKGCSTKSVSERKRSYEVARGSLIEVKGALDISDGLNYTTTKRLAEACELIIRMFQLTSKMVS